MGKRCDCYSVCMRAAGDLSYATEAECRVANGDDLLIGITEEREAESSPIILERDKGEDQQKQ